MKNPFKKSSKSKHNDKMVAMIKELCEVRIPTEIRKLTPDETGRVAYMSVCRFALNNALVEFALGCEIDVEPDGSKVKFNKPLPRTKDVAAVAAILSEFMQQWENPLMANFNASAPVAQPAPDMEIPPENAPAAANPMIGAMPRKRIMMIEKADNKHIAKVLKQKAILGYDLLDAADIMQLVSMGEEARKKSNRNKALIIGGVAILLTGAAVAGYMYYRHKKNEKCEDTEVAVGDEVITADLPDAEDVDLPDDSDVPQVEIE